jgi:hypothetical protein
VVGFPPHGGNPTEELRRMAIILKAKKVNLFVSSVLCVF